MRATGRRICKNSIFRGTLFDLELNPPNMFLAKKTQYSVLLTHPSPPSILSSCSVILQENCSTGQSRPSCSQGLHPVPAKVPHPAGVSDQLLPGRPYGDVLAVYLSQLAYFVYSYETGLVIKVSGLSDLMEVIIKCLKVPRVSFKQDTSKVFLALLVEEESRPRGW